MTDGPVILIIDDEIQIRRLLRISLEANQYRFQEAKTGHEGLEQAALLRPDLIILDLGLPDMDGLEVLTRLREWSQTPVIVLTVRDRDTDKISLLDAGADDYLVKPFSPGELLARMRLALRHRQPQPDQVVFETGALTVDLSHRMVMLNHETVKLTVTEYAILRLLVQHAGKTLTHRQILQEVWGKAYIDQSHYLRVYIAQLRRKLEHDPAAPELILTEPGVGYRLAVED